MNCTQCGQPIAPGAGFCSGCGAPAAAAPAAAAGKGGAGKMWIIGCAIAAVVAVPVVGILAAIVIPNFLSAVNRGKQKRTMGDMKTLASAIEQYGADEGHYPAAANLDELCEALSPNYLSNCPRTDGWHTEEQSREFAFASWGGEPANCGASAESPNGGREAREDAGPEGCGPRHYGLASAGRDGRFAVRDFGAYEPDERTASFDEDLVMIDGSFIRMPGGPQRSASTGDRYDDPPGPPPPPEPREPQPFEPPPDRPQL